MAKFPIVAFKAVVLMVSRGTKEQAMLEEDLRRMGFHRLMERLWCLKYKKILVELLAGQDNRWDRMVQQDSEMWIAVAWCEVYGFPIFDKGMAIQGENFIEGKFTHPPHPKDGYPLPDCKDSRARRVLEFLIPILYPKKLARITITIGNTIFGAYIGERMVDWALVIRNTVRRLLARIRKSKPTPICPYLLHLYHPHDAIQPEDKKVYMVRKSFMRHNVEPNEEEQPASTEELDYKSLSSGEIVKLQALHEKKKPSPSKHKLIPTERGRRNRFRREESRQYLR